MWSFLKHYDGAQPGKHKTASATPAENVREKRAKYGESSESDELSQN
jgi:hypothetical protein